MKKSLKGLLGLFLLVFTTVVIASCSRDSGNDNGDIVISGPGKYSIKATVKDGGVIQTVVIVVDGSSHTFQPNKSEFTSDAYSASNFAASVGGEGVSDKSKLTVELLKDGKVVKTGTSEGKIFSALVSN